MAGRDRRFSLLGRSARRFVIGAMASLLLATTVNAPARAVSSEVQQLTNQAESDLGADRLEAAMDKLNTALKLDPTYNRTIDLLREALLRMNSTVIPPVERSFDRCLVEAVMVMTAVAPQMVNLTNLGNSNMPIIEKGKAVLPLAQQVASVFGNVEKALLDARNALNGIQGQIPPARFQQLSYDLADKNRMFLKQKLATHQFLEFAYESQGEVENAIQQVNWYLDGKPDDGMMYDVRSYLYFKAGDYDRAIADAQRAAGFDRSYFTTSVQRIATSLAARKEYDKALNFVNQSAAGCAPQEQAKLLLTGSIICGLKGAAREASAYAARARQMGVSDPFLLAQAQCMVDHDYNSAIESISFQLTAPNSGKLKKCDLLAWRALSYALANNPDRANLDMVNCNSLKVRNAQAADLVDLARETLGDRATAPAVDMRLLNRPIRQRWGLLVGIGNYKDQTIPKLKYPAKDATDFADYLVNDAHWERDHVKVLVDAAATREGILDALGNSWLPSVAHPDDLVVVFLSTHGTPAYVDVGSLNYIVAFNTNKDRLFSTAIPMQDVCQLIRQRVKADRILLLLDCCYSGASNLVAGDKGSSNMSAEQLFASVNQFVISSSDKNQRSWESKRYPNGVFTGVLLDGLKDPQYVSFPQLFGKVKEVVQQEVKADANAQQTPQCSGHWPSLGLYTPFKSAAASSRSAQ